MLAKEMRFIERFKAQAAKAAQVQSRVKKLDKIEKVEPPKRRKALDFEFPPARARATTSSSIEGVHKALRRARHLRRPRSVDPPPRALGGDGRERRRQVDAAQADRRRDRRPTAARVTVGRQRQARLLRAARDGAARRRSKTVCETLEDAFPLANVGSLRTLAGCFGFSGDDVEKPCRVLSGGEKARLVLAQMLYDAPELPGARRADQPPRHRHQGHARAVAGRLRGDDALRLPRSAVPGAALEPRARARARRPHLYGGGYTEYVARSGHEAPGLR